MKNDITRRRSLGLIGGGIAAPMIMRSAAAQTDLPQGTIRLLIGFPAGGGSDLRSEPEGRSDHKKRRIAG